MVLRISPGASSHRRLTQEGYDWGQKKSRAISDPAVYVVLLEIS